MAGLTRSIYLQSMQIDVGCSFDECPMRDSGMHVIPMSGYVKNGRDTPVPGGTGSH